MKMNLGSPRTPSRLLIAAALCLSSVLTVVGCSSSSSNPLSELQSAQSKNAGNFTNTVFLGDSLTAGYQSGSLLDTQQVHGWAPLVAAQANFNIVLPLIAAPGAPAVLKLVSLGPPPVIVPSSGITTGRDNFATQPTDLAVPGALVNDILNTAPVLLPTSGQQQITQLVLGYPGFGYGQAYSQANIAVKDQPTTIFLWAGNNDALVADLTGTPTSMTSVANFTTQYQALIQLLTTKTSAHLIIANIPDVTAVPYLQPAVGILAQFSAGTGIPAASLSAVLGISAGDFVTPEGLSEIPLILAGKQKGPISDPGVLTAAEVVTAQAQVKAFNQVIAQQAQAAGATLVDINALFAQISSSGIVIGGFKGTANFLGGLFSLDGIHPSNTGYAVVANKMIDTMNASFGTKIADVDLTAVAAADPLWPPNLVKPAAAPAIIMPASAGKSLDWMAAPR